MDTNTKQLHSSELAEYIKTQGLLYEDGSQRLKELNEQYDSLYKDYKLLLLQKERLVNEIADLTTNVDIYSNL